MKRYTLEKAGALLIVIFLIGAFSVNCANAINVKDEAETGVTNLMTWTQTVVFSSLKITEKEDTVSIEFDEIDSYTNTPGLPILPYKSLVATFPLGTKINDVSCIFSEPEKIQLNKPIKSASSG
jgi:hypothetical protein